MKTQEVLDPKRWAEQTFGSVQLHDLRRTRRAVQAASLLGENPLGSLPAQMHTWKETKALYRLLDEPDVTFAALMQPHFQQTRQQANASPVVLLVQDTTDIDLSHRRKISGVGQIGNERGRGFFVQTVLAGKSRRVEESEEEIKYSLMRARSWPSQASRPFEVPARHGRQARSTQLQLAFGQMTLWPPRNEPRASKEPLTVWVIRVWEEQAPEGEQPLEWVLLTSVPTTTLEQAWERVDWYRRSFLVEDYHQCLKSGCRIEQRQLQTVDALIRLLGLLSPLAVRLLQVRACAREDPQRPAYEVIEPLMLAVLAEHAGQSPLSMTVGTFWIEVARMGGYLARSHDGPPGWRTIWKGWLSLQTLLEGAHLILHLRL